MQQKNNLNALIVQSVYFNSSEPDAIIYACDPMQNPGQTQIFDIADGTTWPGQNVTQISQMTWPSFNSSLHEKEDMTYTLC